MCSIWLLLDFCLSAIPRNTVSFILIWELYKNSQFFNINKSNASGAQTATLRQTMTIFSKARPVSQWSVSDHWVEEVLRFLSCFPAHVCSPFIFLCTSADFFASYSCGFPWVLSLPCWTRDRGQYVFARPWLWPFHSSAVVECRSCRDH